jgi:membrane-associated phospholipid phosphatase
MKDGDFIQFSDSYKSRGILTYGMPNGHTTSVLLCIFLSSSWWTRRSEAHEAKDVKPKKVELV